MNELRKLLTARGAFWRDYSSGNVRRTVYQGKSGHVAVISAPDICEEGMLVAWAAGHDAMPPMRAEDVVRRLPPCEYSPPEANGECWPTAETHVFHEGKASDVCASFCSRC